MTAPGPALANQFFIELISYIPVHTHSNNVDFVGTTPPITPDEMKARFIETINTYIPNQWAQKIDPSVFEVMNAYLDVYKTAYNGWVNGNLETDGVKITAPQSVQDWQKAARGGK